MNGSSGYGVVEAARTCYQRTNGTGSIAEVTSTAQFQKFASTFKVHCWGFKAYLAPTSWYLWWQTHIVWHIYYKNMKKLNNKLQHSFVSGKVYHSLEIPTIF
jgi:hypothetical protein